MRCYICNKELNIFVSEGNGPDEYRYDNIPCIKLIGQTICQSCIDEITPEIQRVLTNQQRKVRNW